MKVGDIYIQNTTVSFSINLIININVNKVKYICIFNDIKSWIDDIHNSSRSFLKETMYSIPNIKNKSEIIRKIFTI